MGEVEPLFPDDMHRMLIEKFIKPALQELEWEIACDMAEGTGFAPDYFLPFPGSSDRL